MGHRILYTVGHSTRSWDEFVALLEAWGIEEVVDVRTVPKSRTYPWFSREKMAVALPKAGILYTHLRPLGGFRRASQDSVNTGWQNVSFRGFADYMQTKDFLDGLAQLNEQRKQRRVCIMCSEAVWWRCHRRMISDAEVARGIPVRHIVNQHTATAHQLTEFAKVRDKSAAPVISYPDPGKE